MAKVRIVNRTVRKEGKQYQYEQYELILRWDIGTYPDATNKLLDIPPKDMTKEVLSKVAQADLAEMVRALIQGAEVPELKDVKVEKRTNDFIMFSMGIEGDL